MNQDILIELKTARPMSFQRRNKTLESQGLCSAINSTILDLEVRQRVRKAKDKNTFTLAVERIVSDLVVSAYAVESRWAYRSLCNDKFAGELIKAVTFRKVMGLMLVAGYVEQAKGGNHSNPFHVAGGSSNAFYPGLACRYRATDSLLAIASQYGVEKTSISRHYARAMPANVVRLRAASVRQRGNKISGQAMSVKNCTEVFELRNQVRHINRYLNRQYLEGAVFSGYYRSFNMGNQPDFNWNKGGRLYNPGNDSHQTLKKAARLSKIKINNESVCEIDVNASYLSIFYGLLGYPLPTTTDLYKVRGLHREIVKAWISSAFGKGQFPTRWPAKAKAELKAEGICTAKLTMVQVGQRVCKAIPIMAQLPKTGINWADLMFKESCAIISTMESLRDGYNIPAYSMHDGLIVPLSARDIAQKEMVRAFADLGIECRVKTHA